MARIIGENVVNQVEIYDAIGGGTVVFFYRTPSTSDRAGYQADSIEFKAGRKPKARLRLAETRQKYGLQIITGIREGDVLYRDENGETRPLTSETPGWKEQLSRFAPELVEAMAAHVFEAAAALPPEEGDDEDESGND